MTRWAFRSVQAAATTEKGVMDLVKLVLHRRNQIKMAEVVGRALSERGIQ
jgi:hypothetical protein